MRKLNKDGDGDGDGDEEDMCCIHNVGFRVGTLKACQTHAIQLQALCSAAAASILRV